MKRFKLILSLTVIFFLFFFFSFLSEYKKNLSLKKKVKENIEKLREAEEMEKEVEKIEQSKKEQILKLKAIEERIPQDTQTTINLIEEITKIATQLGIRKIEFSSKKEETTDFSEPTSIFLYDEKIKPLFIYVTIEAEFPTFVVFLKKLAKIKHIISLETIEIKREKKIIPLQKIHLKLVTYIFSSK